jgi:single-strand DNA-binding protein
MVNKVILLGNVGKAPEVRHLESGAVVAKFSLATSEKWKDKQGNKQEETEWHDCEVWEGLAKVVEQYVTAGTKLYLEGKIKTESWEKDGVKQYRKKVRVTSLTMAGSVQSNAPAPVASNTVAKKAVAPAINTATTYTADPNEEEDDLPF